MYSYNHFLIDKGTYRYTGSWQKVNINEIKAISYSKSNGLDNNWIQIKLIFNKGLSYKGNSNYRFEPKEDINYKEDLVETAFYIRLNADYEISGMKERMEKAILHIIKLYGGKAIVKIPPKEPF